MMHALQSDFYGDNFRWFFAKVIDGSPPYGLEGRVKIRIIGVHDDNVQNIPQSDLPWAQVMLPGTTFGSSGFGLVPQVLPGSLVFGLFLDGKQSQLPIVLGSFPKIEYPTSVQADSRDDLTTNPFSYDYTQSNYESVDPQIANLDVTDPNQRKTIALTFFLDNGYTLEQSCGIVGTLFAATELDPLFFNDEFFGIGAWDKRSSRWTRLNRFANAFEPSKTVESFDLQLIFVLNELRTTNTIAQSKLISTEKIKGSWDGTRIDSREITGNGSAAAFYKYFLSKNAQSLTNKNSCETIAMSVYNGAIK